MGVYMDAILNNERQKPPLSFPYESAQKSSNLTCLNEAIFHQIGVLFKLFVSM